MDTRVMSVCRVYMCVYGVCVRTHYLIQARVCVRVVTNMHGIYLNIVCELSVCARYENRYEREWVKRQKNARGALRNL